MSEGEDQSPLSPSLHHSDSIPNIFSQINEYARLENLTKKTCSAQGSIQKSVESSAIRNSVISNLQHVLNLSNISSCSECTHGAASITDSNFRHKPQLRLTDRDHENNQIMSDGGLNLSIMSDDCEVPVKKPKLSPHGAVSEMGHYCFLYQNDRLGDLKSYQESHREHLTELFFLQNGGNLMDYFSWKRRPNNLLACYLFSEKLDNEDISPDMELSKFDSCPTSSPNAFQSSSQKLSDHMSSSFSGLTGLNFTSPCSENMLLSYSQSTPDMALMSTSTPTSARPRMVKDWTPLSTGAGTNFVNSTPTASHASLSSEMSSSAVAAASAAYETSQEAIAELAKQEAQVMEKIMELRKKGLWSVRRIAKTAEPAHAKAHWDYVMEEMQWLAADFGQERKAKKAGARRIGRMVVRHFQEQQQKEVKAEKEDALKLKRIASNLAKCVKEFWTNIEKVVQYKQQSRLEEKRRKALDMHLSFIVDQTEKYSTWLTEGLGASLATGGQSSQPTSANSVASSESSNIDEDFKPNQDSDDDEETIEKEEQDLDVEKTAEEVAALQKEGEMSFEEFLQTLPKEVLNSATGGKVDKPETEAETQEDAAHSDAASYAPSEDSTDDEETLEEQEKQENVNHSEELLDLQKEGEMPIEELLKMYQSMHDIGDEVTDDADTNLDDGKDLKDKAKEEEEEEKEEEENNDNDKDSEVGTEFLIKKEESVQLKDDEVDKLGPGTEINEIAAAAMSIQPTGYTLETAHVKTSVPFLLKHSLREYQHVGLDWLATMYEQRLNGILADEMGLGKTIQTIALLGFLACEKGIWGPHLIVVPTSVMLNWEMEIKKWCPAFKILTYYGSLKERKAKRQGWTKTNAFHVCITSYKLVIQDHQAFRRKKWKYFILDEAQNIKNFKSQRWQTLLNFHSQRRLLLTGTPLQNNLMELWSLMHFLMPHVFASHREFKEWFSNPLTGMIEGSMEYNESLVRRLHKVLRPFLLRRLKQDVEKQMPKKYEHVVMCRLSKRQRFLYDDFMAQAKTKETLATGHFMSVINILMQLRKVCNHPNLFDPRPIVSPFHMEGITLHFPSLAARALERNPFLALGFTDIHPNICDLEFSLSSVTARRIGMLRTKRPLIVEIDSLPDPPPRLEPLPDGTQLVVTFPSESDNQLSAVQTSQDSAAWDPENSIGNAGVQSEMEAEQPFTEKDIVVADKEKQSPLYLESLERKRRTARKAKLDAIHRYNQRRCSFSPVYGRDLLDAVDCMKPRDRSFRDVGYVHCLNTRSQQESQSLNRVWESTRHLTEIILTPQQYLSKLENILHRFVFVIPPATAPRSVMHLSHPSPSARNQQMVEEFLLQKEFSPRMTCLHNIIKNQRVQFPELRLIQYDCGKLQTMDILLRRLKTGGHRALVFTQMTRMLDVLEAFLNFHGHRYLRLDGTTKVEQRQALMERFNMDPRIFCFILSTRSGGIGVNLTGADTVIFYDSDWNPTMDAQAQDRCHRIGQTRDVHIYRLISEKTVEENILKKANEKRLLGNVAIEGGNFTTAFFKQQTIKDLFEEPSGLESLVTDDNKNTAADEAPAPAENGGLNEELIEQALCAAEDETDMQAVKVARAEQKAELAEFDETQPWDDAKTDQDVKKETDDPSSNVEVELALLEKDLTPVERYAVSFMETQLAPITNEELMKAEEEVGLAKEEWELSHLKALKQEEERRAELEEDEMLYTSLHYTAWKQQPKLKELDESFDEVPARRKYKGVGRPSNEMRLERRNLNGMKRSASPTDSWEEDSSLNTTIDDSRVSSSSISTNSSLVRANNMKVTARLKNASKRPKVVTSLVIKVVKKNSCGKGSQSSPGDTPRLPKEPKKRLGKPPKRILEDDSMSPKKKRKKKELISTDTLQFTSEAAAASATMASTLASHAVTPTAATPPKPRPMSVTKLLDSKRYLTSHGQRIIVQRVGSDITATVSSQPPPKPTPTSATPARDLFENKPIPILEKLGASVMTCSISTPLNQCRTSTAAVVSKTTMSPTTVFPSHLHVSRLNQIVSSISQNTIQNVTLAQSTPGTIQYFLRPGGVVSGGVRTENLVLANPGVQQATIGHPTQGTSFVLLPQGLGKASRFIMPTVTSQANKQSVLILPNAGKQNYIVAQQPGNRPGYILIPNNATQQNFILTAAASSGVVLPTSQISTLSVGANISTPPKVVSSFPLLQTQQVQVARQLVSPGLAVGSQQSIPVVQAGISNTVPILEKLAMQLSGTNVIGMSQQHHQQQFRTRIIPSATMVQPSPKQSELVRLGQSVGSFISARQSGSTVMGQLPGGLSVSRQTAGTVPGGKIGGGIVTKQVARQSPVSLLSGNSTPSQSPTGSLVSRLPSAQSSGIVLTGKPMQPVNVAQFIVNQPRSHISVDKLTQLAVNGQLVFVDGRHGQELVTRGSTGQANTNAPKK